MALSISIASYSIDRTNQYDHFSEFIVELSDRITLWALGLNASDNFALTGVVFSSILLGMMVFILMICMWRNWNRKGSHNQTFSQIVWGCLSYFHFTILFQYINWISISITFNTDSEAQIEDYAALRAFAGLLAALNLALAAFNALQTKQSFQYDQKYSFRTFDVATTGVFVKFLASLLRIALP